MALLTPQSPSAAGVAPTFGAVSASDTFLNSGREMLYVKSTNAGVVTVTVNSLKPCDQGTDHDAVISIPATSDRLIGPFAPSRFADETTGLTTVTFSPSASVTIAVIRV